MTLAARVVAVVSGIMSAMVASAIRLQVLFIIGSTVARLSLKPHRYRALFSFRRPAHSGLSRNHLFLD